MIIEHISCLEMLLIECQHKVIIAHHFKVVTNYAQLSVSVDEKICLLQSVVGFFWRKKYII